MKISTAVIGLWALGVESARWCAQDYSSDDCSGDPGGGNINQHDGACGVYGSSYWLTVCSPDLQAYTSWHFQDSSCNGTSTGGTANGLPVCAKVGGSSQRQWCSTTPDCSDPPMP